MAKHFSLKKFSGEEIIHCDSPMQGDGDTALCGQDLIGDSYLGWHAGELTEKKITCKDCIRIIQFSKKVKSTELRKIKQ